MSKNKISGKAQGAKRVKLAELGREINYSKDNVARAEKEWKRICLNVTLPKLRCELLNFWHYFEKLIDTKDFVISLHMDEIRKHEDIYIMNLQNHQNNMQKLMEALSQKLHDIHAENNEFLMTLIQKSLADWDNQIYKADIAESYVKVMRFGLEVLKKRWDKMAKTENFARRNEETSKHTQAVQQLSFVLELKLEHLWDRIRITEENYWQHIRENKKHHDVIKQSDDANNKTVQRELKKLMKLQVVAKRLASKFKELVGTIGKKLKYLQREKESLHELQFALRNKLMQNKDNDALKRAMMSIEFIKAFDSLNAKMKKGENMIMVLNRTRRYQICHEKILPYPVRSSDLEANDEFSVPQLRLIWQRVAEAEVFRYTLNEERTYLKAENQNLLEQIHSHCKCLKCPPLPPIPQRAGKIPYTEGREMVQKQKTQNRTKD